MHDLSRAGSTSGKRRIRPLFKIVLILSGVFVCAITVFVGVAVYGLYKFSQIDPSFFQPADCLETAGGKPTVQWFKEFAAMELPSSAHNVQAQCFAFQDYAAYVSFEMNSSELPSFLGTTFIKLPLSATHKPYHFEHPEGDVAGWQTDKITSFLAGEGSRTGKNATTWQSILIDTSNSENYVVYVEAGG